MGTTRDALKSDDGVQIAFALLIEGYEKLIVSDIDIANTDWETAYSATDWLQTDNTDIIGGLQVPEDVTQRIELFTSKIIDEGMRIVVSPDQDDTFGVDTHKTVDGNGYEATLQTAVDANDNSVVVDDATSFDASGAIWVGTERIEYSSRTSDTFLVSARGTYAPFKANTEANQRFGRSHRITSSDGGEFKPRVSSYPRVWAGRLIRLMAHRVVGGVPDAFDEAETVFAGIIEDIEDTGTGNTVIECNSFWSAVLNKSLLDTQYTAQLKEGVYLVADDRITIQESYQATPGGSVTHTTSELTAVSGTPGTDEIAEGYTLIDDLVGAIQGTVENASFTGDIQVGIVSINDGTSRFKVTPTGYASGAWVHVTVTVTSPDVLSFLGGPFTGASGRSGYSTGTGDVVSATWGSKPPLKYKAYQRNAAVLDVEDEAGSWVDVPADFQPPRMLSGYGFLQIGDGIAVAKRDGAGSFVGVRASRALQQFTGLQSVDIADISEVDYDQGGTLEVKQVVVITNSLFNVLSRVAISTGTNAYNHATFDELDEQLGLGLPWELFGTPFIASLGLSVAQAGAATTFVLDKPTRFIDLVTPELAMRQEHLVYEGDGTYFKSPSTPTASLAKHTIDVDSKAAASGAQDAVRTRSTRTSDFIRNKITIEYNRTVGGEYKSSRAVINAASITDHGKTYPLTIKARNSYGNESEIGENIEDLISSLAATALGYFSSEIAVISVPVSRKHFDIFPGDTVSVTDDFVRNPATGTRGISAYPGWCIGVTKNWREAIATVDIALLVADDSARFTSLSPAGMLDTYNTSTGVATLEENSFSRSADGADILQFEAGDVIRFVEISPASAGSPSTWTDTISSKNDSTFEITTTSNNGNGVWDSAKTYAVIADTYSSTQTSQRVHAFMGDATDGQIESVAAAFRYGINPGDGEDNSSSGSGFGSSPDEHYRYPTTLLANNGSSLNPHRFHNLAVNINSVISDRTAPRYSIAPGRLISGQAMLQSDTSTTSSVLRYCTPVFVGRGGGATRSVTVHFTVDYGGADVSTPGTITWQMSERPPTGSSFTGATVPDPNTSASTSGLGSTIQARQSETFSMTADLVSIGVGFFSIFMESGQDSGSTIVPITLHNFTFTVNRPT